MNDDPAFPTNDRKKAKEGSGHYSLTEGKGEKVWGTSGVYVDGDGDEECHIVIEIEQ